MNPEAEEKRPFVRGDHDEVDRGRERVTPDQKLALEGMIDAVSLSSVLDEIRDICGKKAEYIKYSWQDKELVRAWEKVRWAIPCSLLETTRVSCGWARPMSIRRTGKELEAEFASIRASVRKWCVGKTVEQMESERDLARRGRGVYRGNWMHTTDVAIVEFSTIIESTRWWEEEQGKREPPSQKRRWWR